jgi:hypothetical protein
MYISAGIKNTKVDFDHAEKALEASKEIIQQQMKPKEKGVYNKNPDRQP